MSLVEKIKNILFEVEDDPKAENNNVESIKIRDDSNEEVKNLNAKVEIIKEDTPKKEEVTSERELFKIDNNTFTFPDFDEEEFQSNYRNTPLEKEEKVKSDFREDLSRNVNRENRNSQIRQNNNVLEFERKKNQEKRNEYIERRERMESQDRGERKKFKPSPIISPVYGVLHKDYTADDIVDRNDKSKIDVDAVRKKAFEPVKEKIIKEEEPEVTFLDEKEDKKEKGKFKSIDALLEEASDEITLEDTLEMPASNNLEAIEEELDKISEHEKKKDRDSIEEEFSKDLDDAIETVNNDKNPIDDDLDNDLFELIDSMYDERKEG